MNQIKKFFEKPYRWAAMYGGILALAFAFVLLDAFVIPKAQVRVESPPMTAQPEVSEHGDSAGYIAPDAATDHTEKEDDNNADVEENPPVAPVITDTFYEDENISISIETARKNGTTFYVADILLSDASYLKTALAKNVFGRNIKQTTTAMAEEHQAIFAVNGDYYGFRDTGYVLRNGVSYRDNGNGDALAIDGGGNFSVVREGSASMESLVDGGAWQVFSFGPALVLDGEIVVDSGSEVGKSKTSNPRTAIGQVGEFHYIIIVSDGRSKESQGLSLLELAEEFAVRNCSIAYNLDGGGSSTMVFNGRTINNPTDGRRAGEREVSDIVYIGYE